MQVEKTKENLKKVYLYGLSVLHDGLQNPFHTGKSV